MCQSRYSLPHNANEDGAVFFSNLVFILLPSADISSIICALLSYTLRGEAGSYNAHLVTVRQLSAKKKWLCLHL